MEITNLIGHLEMEADLFRELVSTLHRETECMVGRDYRGLHEVIGLKDHLAMRIGAAAQGRQKLLWDALSALGGMSEGEVNLSAVIALSGARSGELDEAQKTVLSLASTVKEVNALNSRLVESSLGNVVKTLSFLGNFMQPSTYRPTGSFEGFAVKGTRLSEGA